MSADLRTFHVVDDADDAGALITSLDTAKALPGLRIARADLLDALGLGTAVRALDIGCGFGADVVDMAGRMPPGGCAVGLDASRVMIAEARRRTASSGAAVRFLVGDALALPFGDRAFDACRAEMVLQHVSRPQRVLDEMVRVTRPGGRLAIFEFDLGLTVLDHCDRHTTRRILDAVADRAVSGWAGRQLPGLFRRAGLTDVEVSPRVIPGGYPYFRFAMRRPVAQLVRDGVVGARDAVRWWRELEEAERAGLYFGGTTGFLVSGCRP